MSHAKRNPIPARRMHFADTIPVGEASELDEAEAMRALFDDFCVLEDKPTEPMPLDLEPLPEHTQRELWRKVVSKDR